MDGVNGEATLVKICIPKGPYSKLGLVTTMISYGV
jgi:hypothetical protein